MPSEHGGRLSRICPLPTIVETRGIPLCSKRVDRLRGDHRAHLKFAGTQPSLQLALRPKGGDVRSGVTYVIPETSGRHKEVNEASTTHNAGADLEAERLAGSG